VYQTEYESSATYTLSCLAFMQLPDKSFEIYLNKYLLAARSYKDLEDTIKEFSKKKQENKHEKGRTVTLQLIMTLNDLEKNSLESNLK